MFISSMVMIFIFGFAKNDLLFAENECILARGSLKKVVPVVDFPQSILLKAPFISVSAQSYPFKGFCHGGLFLIQGGDPPCIKIRFFCVWTITSLLITRFFFPTPEMKARDHAVRKRHRNQESPKWFLRFCMKHSDGCSQKGGTGWTFCSIYNCRLITPPGPVALTIKNE